MVVEERHTALGRFLYVWRNPAERCAAALSGRRAPDVLAWIGHLEPDGTFEFEIVAGWTVDADGHGAWGHVLGEYQWHHAPDVGLTVDELMRCRVEADAARYFAQTNPT